MADQEKKWDQESYAAYRYLHGYFLGLQVDISATPEGEDESAADTAYQKEITRWLSAAIKSLDLVDEETRIVLSNGIYNLLTEELEKTRKVAARYLRVLDSATINKSDNVQNEYAEHIEAVARNLQALATIQLEMQKRRGSN